MRCCLSYFPSIKSYQKTESLSTAVLVIYDYRTYSVNRWFTIIRNSTMIKTWKHKGLKLFFETGKTSGIQSKHARRLKILLAVLNVAIDPKDINLPGFDFDQLVGNRKGSFAISVNGNYRVTFSFFEHDVVLINYEDYH